MSKCNICNQVFDSEVKLSKHIQHTHKLKKTEYLIQTKYKGITPLCGCGCGQETRYDASQLDFCKFVSGHHSRLKGHWGDLKSEKRVNAIKKTRKEKFASGEYDYIKEAIKQTRKDPKLGDKISKGAKNIPKPKPKGFGIGRIHSQETKDKMSNTAINNLFKSGKARRSNLEIGFEHILEELNLIFTHSFYVPSIKKVYDFYLPEYKILIEIDGDFWHCNPLKYDKPVCKSQEINISNDDFKNKWARDNGYKLLRFWENDINNNVQQVKKTLLENL
jgi:G:T-mismatch repair DNA endonuclease (very short patch repair protein)